MPVLAPILALLLSACGDTPVAEALRGVLPSAEAPAPPSPGGPGLRLAGPRQSIVFTLAQQTGNRRLWRADGGIAVATEGPRITATAGLGQMLTATRQEGPDPLDDVLALLGNPGGNPGSTRRTVDLAGASREPSTMRFGLVIECRLTASRRLGEILVREECTSPAGPFVNRFWADPETGAVLRSEQWVGNEAPAVTMEMR
ncbi:YjbF family lipoprotein [Falsiroseomonas sp.]|uniref:YjbF family lipoprotein n=1 Tax=Falsiroseomonas sp. TaxID=2870721 RepID=UPI003F7113C5